MIDRGISENYVILWLEAHEKSALGIPFDRLEQCVRTGKIMARYCGSRHSLMDVYDRAIAYFNGNQTIAAEVLRRTLIELANPTPVDDALPLPDSPVWEHVYKSVTYFGQYKPIKPPPRLARPRRSSR